MNSGLENKLSEVNGSNNVAYIIHENSSFSRTGYKVMQSHTGSGLLKCAKLTYNGKIKLVYLVENLRPLSFVAMRSSVNELNVVVFNLIQRALEIKANGFFKAENLELDLDKIFVDMSDNSVHLVYFPISGGATGKLTGFENEFRIALIKLFNSFPVFRAPQFQRLCSNLSNGSLSLEQIAKRLQDNISGQDSIQGIVNPVNIQGDYIQRGGPTPSVSGPNGFGGGMDYQNPPFQPPHYGYNYEYSSGQYRSAAPTVSQPAMTITAINSPVQMSLTVNTPEYLIGKNPEMVNGVLQHNPAISRVHCKVTFKAGRYYLTDMGSANGTYVNQQRVEKQQTVELQNGDCLKLANSEFIISF